MSNTQTEMQGAYFLGDEVTLADIWIGLHSDAVNWRRAAFASDAARQRAAINENTVSLLRALEPCTAKRWKGFIEAQGITQYGAIALSWCQDATLEDVTTLFFNDIDDVAVIDRRAAMMLAPEMSLKTRSLSSLIAHADNQIEPLVLLCLGDPQPLQFDVGIPSLAEFPDSLGALLLERYDSETDTLPDDLQEIWRNPKAA
jgi:hypothetical protein